MKKLFSKKKRGLWVHILLLLIGSMFMFCSYQKSQESVQASVRAINFVGEYRQGDGEWKTYDKSEKISALKGDLVLRGNFGPDLSEVEEYQFYLDHIELTIYRDGEKVFSSVPEYELTPETTCVKTWHTWFCEPVHGDEILELHLHNPHQAGNIEAYDHFLKSVFICPVSVLEGYIQSMNQWKNVIAILFVIVAIIFLGMAAGFYVVDSNLGKRLWPFGALTLFMGGYLLFDLQAGIINYFKGNLYTNGLRICMMLAAYELTILIQAELVKIRNGKIFPVVYLLGIFDTLIFGSALFCNVSFYDTLIVWQLGQGVAFLVQIVLIAQTFRNKWPEKWNMLCSETVFAAAILAELLNSHFGWWIQGILWKVTFGVFLLYHLITEIGTVPRTYRASKEAERLEGELKNSRVVLAMSQIRTHFIFNVLNAISGMCQYDPEEANRTVVHFAKYLRGNINVLQDDELILFRKELEHLEAYIVLEQVRFEERIRFEKELETEAFLIPPLILQPIVENAIKHGLLRSREGGCVRLKTRKEGDEVVLEVQDDGVGFDTSKPVREGAVGLSNVKFRLEYMIDGKMYIESEPGKGTRVTLRIPCKRNS